MFPPPLDAVHTYAFRVAVAHAGIRLGSAEADFVNAYLVRDQRNDRLDFAPLRQLVERRDPSQTNRRRTTSESLQRDLVQREELQERQSEALRENRGPPSAPDGRPSPPPLRCVVRPRATLVAANSPQQP